MILFLLLTLPREETLVYSVKYGFLPAGDITLRLKKDSLYHIECIEKSSSVFSLIFNVDDYYLSVSDTNFATQLFEKNIKEGSYSCYQRFSIKDGFAIYNDNDTIEVINDAKDIINIVYWFRTINPTPLDTIIIHLHSDKKNYKIKVPVTIEKIENKTYTVAKPDLKNIKVFGSEGDLILYYDEKKIPVMLKIKFKYGYLEAKLKDRQWSTE